MNQGYQADDTAIIDYRLWRPPGLDSDLRGPPVPLEPGGYIVALGAAPDFFQQRPEMLALVNGARLAIVQAMSGRSIAQCRFLVRAVRDRTARLSRQAARKVHKPRTVPSTIPT